MENLILACQRELRRWGCHYLCQKPRPATRKKIAAPPWLWGRRRKAFQRDFATFDRSESAFLCVPVRVDRCEAGPLLRQVFEGEDCGYRTDRNTSAAINALHWANVKLGLRFEIRLIFPRVDAIHRADIHTGSILGSDTGLSNYVRHRDSPSRGIWGLTHSKETVSLQN